MKRITFLLTLLLLCFAGGVKAGVITTTPQAGVQYKIKCIATDHTGYLGDDGTTLQGRHATGTFFILEATGTEGQYYLKSVETNKYINAAGNTNGSAISFDATASTYWTIDQTNADVSKNSWAIRPNGTTGVSLNNNGAASNACPYMKVNVHNSSTQGCDLWTFDDGAVTAYAKPAFGGTVWTWNTETSVFDASGQASTATPARDGKGPVYKFDNVGTVSKSSSEDTSDSGGIWVIGSSNVTCSLGSWAGSILVEDYAVANVSIGYQHKGTEPVTSATVWVNGTLSIAGGNYNMDDGGNQRWYIGENSVINTAFTSVTKSDSRTWDIQVVVADEPQVTGKTRVSKTIKKQVMTWGDNISSHINSITVWYKDAEGNTTLLDAGAVTYDATGITITYEGLGYDEKTPVLPEDKYILVSGEKANFITPATSASDNEHWYVMTQARNGETAMYDNGSAAIHRASVGTSVSGNDVTSTKKYLVRFFETSNEGAYEIQFGTGKFITKSLTTDTYVSSASYKLYNINDETTHIGWNLMGDGNTYGSIVDNNGAGADLAFWESGQVTTSGNNNDWSVYPVSFVDGVNISYTLSAVGTDQTFNGTYIKGWDGNNTPLPVFAGANGYTLSNAAFVQDGENYSMTADITFPFPVSTSGTKNATGIESALGSSKWFVHADGYPAASNAANTECNFYTQDNYKWYIYPTLTDGTFSFKIQYFDDSYIPVFTAAQSANTQNPMVSDEASAGSFYFLPCTNNLYGFSINAEGTIFLTVNTSGTNQAIWAWTKGGGHQGSNLTFPNVTITEADVNAQFENFKNAAKFDILEGSIVQGPSEFAAPGEINTAIDNAQSVDGVDAKITFMSSEDGQKIQTYLNAVNTYGALTNYQFEVKYPYSTLILPCPSTRPSGITLYGCSATEEDGTTLTLSSISGNIDQNVPYIIESTVGNKYTIIGWDKGSRATHTSGWLVGNLAETAATVPTDSYVLAANKTTGHQAFYVTDGTVTCPQYKCYLTVSTGEAAPRAFFFPGDEGQQTGIENVFGGDENGTVTIYNLAGQRLNKLEKGINIVNGRKVLVK